MGIPMGIPVGRPAFLASRRARGRITSRNRGYLRTGGYYGRFSRRPSAAGNELKFLDTPSAATTQTVTAALLPVEADATGALTTWDVIPEGTGPSERVGRKCTIKQIFIKGELKMPADSTAVNTSDKVRVILVQDKQHNGSASEAAGSLILEGDNVNAFRNLEETGRFKVLAERTITMSKPSGDATSGFGQVRRSFTINLPKTYIPLEYSGSTGGTTELRSNHLSLFCVGQGTGTLIECNMRCRYADN